MDAMNEELDHERAFISVFVVPEKRARYTEFLGNPKRRARITGRFGGFFDFVSSLAHRIPRGTGSEIAPLLRARGAGDTAHVIGGRDEIDGHDLPLEDAIDAAVADPRGVVVSCIPGRLAPLYAGIPARRHLHFKFQAVIGGAWEPARHRRLNIIN